MNARTLCVCAVVALAVVMASAQTKSTLSGKCSKPDVQHSIPTGDQAGHAFTLAQGKCTAMGEVDGAAGKEGLFSEHGDATATHVKTWGVFCGDLRQRRQGLLQLSNYRNHKRRRLPDRDE